MEGPGYREHEKESIGRIERERECKPMVEGKRLGRSEKKWRSQNVETASQNFENGDSTFFM